MIICTAVGCGNNSNTSECAEYKFILTVMRRGIKNCMEAKIMARKVARRWKYQSMQFAFWGTFWIRFTGSTIYSIHMSIYISHNLSKSCTESLIKLLWSYSEYCDSSCVFNYRSRQWHLCYNIFNLHVWLRILENASERKSSLLIKL